MSLRWKCSGKHHEGRQHGWKLVQPLAAALTVVALATAAFAYVEVMKVPKTIKHVEKSVSAQPPKPGLEVTRTVAVLDAAGARCAASLDGAGKLCRGQLLYPVHAPVGTSVTHTTYVPDNAGTYRVAKSDDPALPVGLPISGVDPAASGFGRGKAVPMHSYYASTGWHHFPCNGCTSGRILQSAKVSSFQVCILQTGCPIKLGPVNVYSISYTQQIYGAFLKIYGATAVYNFAHYWAGADYALAGYNSAGCNCQRGVRFSNDGDGPNSLFWYRDNFLMELFACGPPSGSIGFAFYAADMQFTSRGDYTEAGWVDTSGFANSCATAFGSLSNGTHMA